MLNLGTIPPGSELVIPFSSFASDTGAPITLTGLAASDILIYKNGGTTQRASDAGITLLDTDGIDFDSLTGIHAISINLADDTTADFYKSGSQYFVAIGDVTIDSQTVRFIAATFRIGYPWAAINTYIDTLSSQTSFTLASGPAEDDALNGCSVCLHDKASAVQTAFGVVSDYVGATKTVTLAAAPTFTISAGDNIAIAPRANAPTNWHAAQIGASGAVEGNVVEVLGAAVPEPGTPEVDVVAINGFATIDGLSVAKIFAVLAAALAGKSTGSASNAPVHRNLADTLDRIAATVDGDGNRTAVTLVTTDLD